MYIFDACAFMDMFNYYPKRFPSLWNEFDELVSKKRILSVKEVFKEINVRNDLKAEWANRNKEIFLEPDEKEASFISEIFKIKHFQSSLKSQQLLKGGNFADPFVIASAKIREYTVVTQEKYKKHGAKIPNICEYFSISCLNLEGFMEKEDWQF